MIRRFLAWLWLRFFVSRLTVLTLKAQKIGRLTIQQVDHADHVGWTCSLRARQDGGGPRYAWTGTGDSLEDAIEEALENAREYEIGSRPVLPHSPKLGGKMFDE